MPATASALPQASTTLSLSAAADTSSIHVTQMPAELGSDDLTYEILGRIRLNAGQLQVWEQTPNDAVSEVLARNTSSHNIAQRVSGVGSALLEQLSSGAPHYRQTVANTTAPSSRSQIQTQAAKALNELQSQPSASLELRIKTQSGATVTLRIVDQQDARTGATGISAEIQVDGTLSAAEQKAVQALAGGFERAVQSLVGDETQVGLAKLTQFDSTLITRLDLQAKVYGRDDYGVRYQKLGVSFRADTSTREIKIARPDGEVAMSIDLRQPAFWGSAAQKAKAVDKYLARMDQAATRGRADRDLVQMFKSTFASLTASYGAQESNSLATREGALSEDDASWLTGLADFKAQLTATPRISNPRKRQEVDRFQYTVDQTTRATGSAATARTVDQAQNARLSAAYHQSLFSSAAPKLDSTTASQNYYYKQVEDSTTTQVRLQYDKHALVAASLTQLVEQSLRAQKFEHNKLLEDNTVSSQKPSVTDLLPLLKQLKDREDRNEITAEEKRQLLATWNDRVFATSST
ncbi:hypothetical protein [Rhodoferax saidenbachensis]|uniref:hypothetical protein n=1 Tax=Rhodoferax saidenbachensis TaxID=1484693 RepID=UPI001268F802|nr:hypothetical protein [Rhodoferax saidenbachensis]